MAPTVKVSKPSMYKMISYKGVSGAQSNYTPITAANRLGKVEKSFGAGMTTTIAGINSLGQTLNSIARNTEFTLESWKSNIRSQIKDNKLLTKKEKIADKAKVTRTKKKDKEEKDRRKKTERDDAENKTEKDPLLRRIGETFAEKTKAVGKGLFGTILSLFGNLIGTFITYKIFDWISNNPKKVTAFFKVIEGIGKFIFNVAGFFSGMWLDGLANFFENPISLKGFFGIFQFLLGATPLFAAFAFLKNPKKGVEMLGSIISKLGNGLKSLFGFGSKEDKLKQFKLKKATGHRFGKVGKFMDGKLGKGLLAGGAAVSTFGIVKAAGGSTSEAGGAAVGAAGGQMAGAALGAATGIPGAGALGGMIGSMAGGTVGKAVGGLIEPITKPIGEFFKMIGDTFGSVINEIKKPMEEFFTVLGEVMGGIIDAIKPHMPIITKIISTGIKVLFWPLFLGMKALTAVLKLFVGGGDKKEDKGSSGLKGGQDTGLGKSQPKTKTITKVTRETKIGGEPYTPGQTLTERQRAAVWMKLSMGNKPPLPPHVVKDYWDSGGPLKAKESQKTDNKGKPEVVESKDSKNEFDFAKGGLFKSGGWISGPQSGYPVSLDGGRSTAFIGHGTEWVGSKMASGGAFVVPFDTPATRQRPGLTKTRLGEAKRQGYALPQAYDQRLQPYMWGGGWKKKDKGKKTWEEYKSSRKYQNRQAKINELRAQDTSNSRTISSASNLNTRWDMNTGKAYINGKEVPLQEYADFKQKSSSEQLDSRGIQTKFDVSGDMPPERLAAPKPTIKERFLGGLGRGFNALPQVRAAKWLGGKAVQGFNALPGVRAAKWLGGKLGAKDEEGKPAGMARWLAGALDTATGNAFDFDKRGNLLDGAKNIKDRLMGDRLEEAQQRENTEKFKQLQEALDGPQVVAMEEQAAPIIGSNTGEDVPFVIPSDHELDADKFIKPKYGLLPEFMTDPVEFM